MNTMLAIDATFIGDRIRATNDEHPKLDVEDDDRDVEEPKLVFED